MNKIILKMTLLVTLSSALQAEYFVDASLDQSKIFLTKAQTRRDGSTTFEKIYNEISSWDVLKGFDEKSLFLDSYFSTSFYHVYQTYRIAPENLTDNLYNQILAPLGGRASALGAFDLTGILSRVQGIVPVARFSFFDSDHMLKQSFSQTITGRGRFKVKRTFNVYAKKQLILDIYRKYNTSMQGNHDLHWNEIVGDSYQNNADLGHVLSCFAVSYFAAASNQYGLKDASVKSDVLAYIQNKMGSSFSRFRKTINIDYLYGVLFKSITDGSVVDSSFMQHFYTHNSYDQAQNRRHRYGQLNQQLNILKTLDPDDYIPSLKFDGDRMSGQTSRIALLKSLGRLSFQTGLISYSQWEEIMIAFFGRAEWQRVENTHGYYELVKTQLEKNVFRENTLFTFMQQKVNGNRIFLRQIKDPEYVNEKTAKTIAKEEAIKEQQRRAEEKRRADAEWQRLEEERQRLEKTRMAREQAARDAVLRGKFGSLYNLTVDFSVKYPGDANAEKRAQLKNDWEEMLRIENILLGILNGNDSVDLNGTNDYLDTLVANAFAPKKGNYFWNNSGYNKTKFTKAYSLLTLVFHPDKNPQYEEHFKTLSALNGHMDRFAAKVPVRTTSSANSSFGWGFGASAAGGGGSAWRDEYNSDDDDGFYRDFRNNQRRNRSGNY